MALLTVGEVALALDVSPSTVRNYTDNSTLKPYLSHTATRTEASKGAKERQYVMEDVYVLNTVKLHKTRSNSWDDVAQILEQGIREQDLPESAMLVQPETRADSFQLVAMARQKITMLQEQVEALQTELEGERADHRGNIERLMLERSTLHETIGKLNFILQMHQIDPKTGKPISSSEDEI